MIPRIILICVQVRKDRHHFDRNMASKEGQIGTAVFGSCWLSRFEPDFFSIGQPSATILEKDP